jgi:hypothetical protein
MSKWRLTGVLAGFTFEFDEFEAHHSQALDIVQRTGGARLSGKARRTPPTEEECTWPSSTWW